MVFKKILFSSILLVTILGIIDKAFGKSYEIIHICSESGFLPYEMRTVTGECSISDKMAGIKK